MASKNVFAWFVGLLVAMATLVNVSKGMSTSERRNLRDQVAEMFNHGYSNYMKHAYPADELMPLSCKGRYRGRERSRGDIDECMGNFSLTLIDSLDTLAILGQVDDFENAVRLVIKNTKFDSDVVVSVFETNIRVLGGLLGGHVMASFLKKKRKGMLWYNNELRDMAREVGMRLLPAFNTTTGIPYPKVNLLHGIDADLRSRHKDTCTACAGTIILEFAALSRLTGESIFEEKARKAMDYLWQQRHRVSDLVGTVINIHNGDWVRRESGVGAGIDSYYEYVLKGYILLGDNTYLERFNKHYEAVMKYISQGPLLVDVHMHKPQSTSRNFMDSLLAFWPGLQVLKGDLKPAIETHEMLFQVIKRHNFLPEAFTTDFRIHWGQHPLRPEFVESTYFLYKATNDPYYLEVGKKVVENLNKHARVPCGYASIKDVTIGSHEDQMDSFVLAETFKYLYLLFAEDGDSIINVDDYIFTTEAHLLPLTLSVSNTSRHASKIRHESYQKIKGSQKKGKKPTPSSSRVDKQTCPNLRYLHRGEPNYAHSVREQLKDMVENVSPKPKNNRRRFRAIDFMAGNKEQLEILGRMGIRLMTMTDGRIQLLHTASEAASPMDAEDGMKFMQEMIELSKNQHNEAQHEPLIVQILPPTGDENSVLSAGPAQFGYNLKNSSPVQGRLMIADPYKACSPLTNAEHIKGHIAILERGDCMFIEKASNIEAAGAIGGIVIDHNHGSSSDTSPLFAMSGDGHRDVSIPLMFLFHKEGQKLLETLSKNYNLEVLLALDPRPSAQAKTPTEAPPKTTPVPGNNRPRRTFQHLKTIQSFQTPARAMKAEEFLYQPAMDRKPYNFKREPLILDDKDGNYYLRVGSNNVYMEISIISLSSSSPSSTASSSIPSSSSSKAKNTGVIHLHLLPDGTKQLAFHFAHLSKREPSHNKPKLNQIYIELVSLLKERTNFPQLDLQSQYLRAITRVLEAAYFNFGKLDASEKVVLDQLAFELIIIKDEPQVGVKDKAAAAKESETETEGLFEKEAGEKEQVPKEDVEVEYNLEDSQSDNDVESDRTDDQKPWLAVISENNENVESDMPDGTENKRAEENIDRKRGLNLETIQMQFGEGVEQFGEQKDDEDIPVGSDSENILIVNNDHTDDSTQYGSAPSESLLDVEREAKDEL